MSLARNSVARPILTCSFRGLGIEPVISLRDFQLPPLAKRHNHVAYSHVEKCPMRNGGVGGNIERETRSRGIKTDAVENSKSILLLRGNRAAIGLPDEPGGKSTALAKTACRWRKNQTH